MSDMVLEQVKALAASLPPDERAELVEWLNGSLEPTPPIAAEPSPTIEHHPLTREEARRRLLAAGKLASAPMAPEGAIALSDEERERLAKLFGSGPLTTLDIINEDRGPR